MASDASEHAVAATPLAGVVGGHLVARRLKAHGVTKLFTLSGGHLFSIYDGCRAEGIDIVDVRHEQSAAFAAEGWAKVDAPARRRRADRRAGRHERHERDRLGAAEPLADARARRARAGDALGPGLAAGARPRAVRRAADEVRGDVGVAPAEIPALDRRGAGGGGRAARRAGVRRLPARPRLRRGRRRARAPVRAARRRPPGRAADGDGARRARSRCCAARARPVVMAGHRPVLGPRRGRAARARRGAADPGLPQRPRARLRARRPRAVLLARAARGAAARPTSRSSSACRWTSGSASAACSASETALVVVDRVRPRAAHPRAVAAELYGGDRRDAAARCARRAAPAPRIARRGSRGCARPSARRATASAPSAPTTARRCTRCASTASSASCWTATRSSSATAATSSPTRAA